MQLHMVWNDHLLSREKSLLSCTTETDIAIYNNVKDLHLQAGTNYLLQEQYATFRVDSPSWFLMSSNC
jgi:hypothetical protein